MKLIRLFLPALLMLRVISANAQLGFGAEVGLNASDYTVKVAGKDKDTKIRFGMRMGGLMDCAITDNLFLQPGLYYVANGYKANFTGGHEEYSINTVEIPVNIMYKIGRLGASRLFVGAGPFIGYNIHGYYKIFSPLYVDSRSDLRVGGGATDQVNNLDAGLGVNVGYQLAEGLFLRARGQAGFVNMAVPVANENNILRSYSFGISAGYIFYAREKDGTLKIARKKKDRHSKTKK